MSALFERSHPIRTAVSVGVLVACGLVALTWWSTAVSTSMARIAAMQPVEAYAFAVYHQIVHNLANAGVFEQTVHQGYDDAWTWSGHRAPALFTTAALYRLDGGAFGLARVQILQVLLGVIPAAFLGWRATRGHAGGLLLGTGLYLGTPAVLAMALQDYQDLVLAVPFLLALAAALRARHWAWLLPGLFCTSSTVGTERIALAKWGASGAALSCWPPVGRRALKRRYPRKLRWWCLCLTKNGLQRRWSK